MKRLLALAALAALGCGNDDPVAVGGPLLPGERLTSYQVILEPEDYIVLDSAFAIYDDASDATFGVIANEFDDTYFANLLARFSLPGVISVRDTVTSSTVVDSTPVFLGGRLVLEIDTLRSTGLGQAQVGLYPATEAWDAGSATWEQRIDTTGVEEAWTQPGGTRGPLIAQAPWAGQDSLIFTLDASDVALLRDSAQAELGLIMVGQTPETRLRVNRATLLADARSDTARTDTVVTLTASARAFTYVQTPQVDGRFDGLRVGGIPTWRSLIRFRERLDTLRVPCSTGLGCTVALGDVNISQAMMLLELERSPQGFILEDSVRVFAWELNELPTVPFARTPVGRSVSASVQRVSVPWTGDPSLAPTIELPITDLLRVILNDTVSASTGVALLPSGPRTTLGILQFADMPRLRLVLTESDAGDLP